MTDDLWPKGETTEIKDTGRNIVLYPTVRKITNDYYFFPARNTCSWRKWHGNRRARERAARRWLRACCPTLTRGEILDGGRAAVAARNPESRLWRTVALTMHNERMIRACHGECDCSRCMPEPMHT